jgi:site-specific recombinase XerD
MLSKAVLRNKDKNGNSTVYIQYIHNGETLRIPTGVKVSSDHFKSGRLTKGYGESYKADNTIIDNVEDKVNGIIKSHFDKIGIPPSVKYVGEEYYKEGKKLLAQENGKGFFEFFKEYIEGKDGTIAYNSLKSIKVCYKCLMDFEESTNYTMKFSTINNDFFSKFYQYCVKIRKMQNSTIARLLVVLKVFVDDSVSKGYAEENRVGSFKVKVKTRLNEVVVLTEDELKQLEELDLKNNQRLDYVRDFFLLMASTGLRFSDAIQLNRSKVYNGAIHTAIEKTKDRVSIPLNRTSRAILEKYNYEFRPISNQKFNDYIKEVAVMLPSMHREISNVKYIGANQIVETSRKYELIAAHTGRRTFITTCIIKGVPLSTIMKWSNHKKLDVFQRYINNTISEFEFMERAFG